MSQVQRYILDVPLSKEDIKELKKEHNMVITKEIVLSTDSLFWFNRLCQFPKLYKLCQLLPQVKNAPSLLKQYNSLRIKKRKQT